MFRVKDAVDRDGWVYKCAKVNADAVAANLHELAIRLISQVKGSRKQGEIQDV